MTATKHTHTFVTNGQTQRNALSLDADPDTQLPLGRETPQPSLQGQEAPLGSQALGHRLFALFKLGRFFTFRTRPGVTTCKWVPTTRPGKLLHVHQGGLQKPICKDTFSQQLRLYLYRNRFYKCQCSHLDTLFSAIALSLSIWCACLGTVLQVL